MGELMKTRVIQNNDPGVPRGGGSDHVITTEGLGKRYRGGVEALSAFDLTVPRHSIFGFLGPNGAGKTTAIKLLLGLSRPTSGHATLFGLDSVRDSLAIRTRIGYLAQDPRFYPHMTARETLTFAARFFYRGPSKAIRARVGEALELVGLEGKADRPVRGFSGGERQRLGIAQAQVNRPDLLILDDPVGRRDVLEVMARLRAHTTIFYSTHILSDVERVSDHVAIVDRGRLVASSPTDALLAGGTSAYRVTVRGEGEAAAWALRACSWVGDVMTEGNDGTATLTVSVTDEEAAEAQLLRTVLTTDAVVTAFGRKHLNLEDVFLQLVEGPTR
jgi:ABC-2 type transport system ATP-binding protein